MKNNFEFDVKDFLDGDSMELEFNAGDFTFVDTDAKAVETRYIKPTFSKRPIKVDYKNAKDLALSVKCQIGEQVHALVKGDFILGDFIEALLVEKNLRCEKMYISTLSMSQNNIDSLAGLIEDDYIKELDLVVSNYFYSHEKTKLMAYLLKKCDINNRFDVAVMRTHAKVSLLKIKNLRIIISGSGNLRSSQCVEQIIIQEDAELFSFYEEFFTKAMEKSIIDKKVEKS